MFYFAEMRSFLWKPFLCTDKEVICPLSATGSSWEDPIKVIILVLFDFVILVIIFILLSGIGGYPPLPPLTGYNSAQKNPSGMEAGGTPPA